MYAGILYILIKSILLLKTFFSRLKKLEWKGRVSGSGFGTWTRRKGGRSGGVFNFADSQAPTSYNSVGHPHQRGVAFVEIWLNQGWAVAAGSWALTTLSSSSSLNYEGWAKAASLITVSDCPSVGVSQMAIAACAWYKEKEGHFSLVSQTLFLHENSKRTRSDWLERKEMFHDLASQNPCKTREGWGCTGGAVYVAYSVFSKKMPKSLTCWVCIVNQECF